MVIRRVKWAVLAVGEGDAEVALLQHLKTIYIARSCGSTLRIQQAYGKGAGNVVRHAIRYGQGQGYDRCIALFDTDTDYTADVKALAKASSLIEVPSDPCLEALLLRIHGDVKIRISEQHKAEFSRRFGGRIQDVGVLETSFPRDVFEEARKRENLIHLLINTFGVPR
ncbi:hypothetical protein [Roseateles cavernae]|uniref:hypothetical protein n=1 Tax=Roseateles cavernae TaxID=3153578 RepID=UPI0032E5018C